MPCAKSKKASLARGLLFGVNDQGLHAGLADIKQVSAKVGELIAARISPIPMATTNPFAEDGKGFLALSVSPGRATPYSCYADGIREIFVRIGNATIPAPDICAMIG